MVNGSTLEARAAQDSLQPTDSLTYFYHHRFPPVRRNPRAVDLAKLLSTIHGAALNGITVSALSVDLIAEDEEVSVTSLDSLKEFISGSEEYRDSPIIPQSRNHQLAYFTARHPVHLPCEGAIYLESRSDYAKKMAAQWGTLEAGAGLGGVLGLSFWSLVFGEYLPISALVPLGGILTADGLRRGAYAFVDWLKVDLFYTGPAECNSREWINYQGFLRDLK